MNFINKVELKYQLERIIKVESGYIKKSEIERVILAEDEAQKRNAHVQLFSHSSKILRHSH